MVQTAPRPLQRGHNPVSGPSPPPMLSGIDGAGVKDWAGSRYERHEFRSVFSLGAGFLLRQSFLGIETYEAAQSFWTYSEL